MQNTSNIPNIPTTLISNFFIAGAHQKTLSSILYFIDIYPQPKYKKTNHTAYLQKFSSLCMNLKKGLKIICKQINNFLNSKFQLVFPEKIAVEYQPQDPKFYTFMSTDSSGYNSFFHVLIFYEEINEAEITSNDFDIVEEILRKQHLSKKNQSQKTAQQNDTSSPNKRDRSSLKKEGGHIQEGQLFQQQRKKQQEIFQNRKKTTQCMCASDLFALRQQHDKTLKQEKEQPSTPKGASQMRLVNNQKLKDEKLKQNDFVKKQKIERIIQDIKEHGQNQMNQSQYSLNNTINQQNQNLRVSQIDTQQLFANFNKSFMKRPNQIKGLVTPQMNAQSISYIVRRPNNEPKLRPLLRKEQSQVNVAIKRESSPQVTPSLGQVEYQRLDESVTFSGAIISQKQIDQSSQQSKPSIDEYDIDNRATSKLRETTSTANLMIQEDNSPKQIEKTNKSDNEFQFDHNYEAAGIHVGMEMQRERLQSNTAEINHIEKDLMQELYDKKRYVPVALCLQTETEYHDIFRQILLQLFELIRVPTNHKEKIFENRTLAFAELIAHLAFLRTIPAPSFNCIYNLHCMNKIFTIKESGFDQIPNRNQNSIKILFDVLDLVLVSSQYSLQFYVADALKQLLFPMTWQNSYIQPGNEVLAGRCDGTIVCLYGSNSITNGFDYFDGLQHPDIVICDIDGGYTNNISLPCVPDETMYIRILNMLKNSKINNYDKAFPNSEDSEEPDDFVSQIRETFFCLLKPFLLKVENYIDQDCDPKTAFFQKYFKEEEYLSYFKNFGDQYYNFAKELVQSSQFIHFCDDYFSDLDLTNFKMLKDIFMQRGELNSTKVRNNTQGPFNNRKRSTLLEGFTYEDLKRCKSGNSKWPESDPVVFNIRMPVDQQRVMLFEKILYMIEDSLLKKERDITRKTNEHLLQNKNNLKYEKFIKKIKLLYPQKLKDLHMKVNQHQMDINNNPQIMNRKRKLTNQMSSMDISTTNFRQAQPNNNIKTPQQHQKIFTNPSAFKLARDGRNSSDSIQIVETDGAVMQQSSSSFVDQIQLKFHQSNVFTNNALGTPLSQMKQNLGGLGTPSVDQNSDYNNLRQQYMNSQNRTLSNGQQIVNGIIVQMDYENNTNEYAASFTYNNSVAHYSYLEQEQQRVQACAFKTTRFMYGQKGLITFLHHLFGLLNEKQKKRVNYYFAIKTQLETLIQVEKKQSQLEKEKRENKPIIEEQQEEEKSPTNRIQTANFNDHQGTKTPGSIASNDYHKFNIVRGSNFNLANQQNLGNRFKNDREWLTIDQWENRGTVLKTTYQYQLFKMKLYESFEQPEDAFSQIWKLLLKFPSNYMKYFPSSKFQQIWDNLTKSQQDQQFQKLAMRAEDRPQINMICKYYLKMKNQSNLSTCDDLISTITSSNRGRTTYKNDETLFYDVNLENNYVQKKLEKKERQKKLANKLSCKSESKIVFSSTNNSNDIIKKYEAKKQKVIENNQKSILSFLKKKLNDKQKSQCSSSNLYDKGENLSVAPLSTKSISGDKFTFKNIGTHIETLTPRLEKESQSENSSFTAGKRTVAKNSYDYELRNNSRKSPVQISVMKDPVGLVSSMLSKIMKFWKNYSKYTEKKGSFKESELVKIQNDMRTFDKYLNIFKSHQPQFGDKDDVIKQCFFLNLFNFLVLYQISLLMISNPEAILRLKSFNMWQSFLVSTSIKIGFHKVSAHTIMHNILRHKLSPPKISQFILNQPDFEQDFSNYKVLNPHKLLNFGIYLPIKKIPQLRIFNEQDFDNDLRKSAQIYMRDRIKLRHDFYLIDMPKFIDWFGSDCYVNYYELIQFINSDIFEKQGSLKQIKEIYERINQKQVSINDYIIEFSSFCWEFKPTKMSEFFPDHHNLIPSNE